MKSFTLTIIYDGHKTTSKLETDTQVKEETTLEEIKAAYIQIEFARERLKDMQNGMIHKMRELKTFERRNAHINS